jgi:uncharacterized protein (TIGR03435 family)
MKLALSIAMATLTPAQPPGSEKPAKFEVASVKPAAAEGFFTMNFLPGGGISARNMTVHNLLRNAYGLQDYQISGGPGWIDSAGFDIQARAAASPSEPTREQVRGMMQALLADRFHLVVHREIRQLPIYTLAVGKGGPRLQAADIDLGPPKSMIGQMVVRRMSMTTLGDILAFDLKRPVKDETGLEGEFAFKLEWTPGLGESDSGPSSRPSLFTAVKEQLGLKLESAKGPIDVLVIDSVEKPTEN